MIKIEIIYEDNHLLVVNKPAGWLVQGDATGDETLTDWGKQYVKQKYDKPGAVFLHPVHRIDRPVSGAVVFARTSKALERLAGTFHDRKVEKTYWALVAQKPAQPSGELRHWLWKDETRNLVKAFPAHRAPEGSKEAILKYEYSGTWGTFHLIRVFPITGRPHQIRVQLSEMGCPVLGDLKYGAPSPLPDASIGLHCRRMILEHPVKKERLVLEAPTPPAHWWKN